MSDLTKTDLKLPPGVAEVLPLIAAALVGLYSFKSFELPAFVVSLFNNLIFRLVYLAVLLIPMMNNMPGVAVSLVLIFLLTLHYIDKQETKETFAYVESFRTQTR